MISNFILHSEFDSFYDDPQSSVFEVFPRVFKDHRGYFCEVKKCTDNFQFDWFNDFTWIKQMNRSSSKGKTVRGCHAQKGKYCQAKLVQALTAKIYDIITDARPNSKTFGISKVFILDPIEQNQLFVPRGFLHSFVTVEDKPAIFEYFCDNVFDKESEIGISPMSILPKVISELEKMSFNNSSIAHDFFELFMLFKDRKSLSLSDKDQNAIDYKTWMDIIFEDYVQNRNLWYK